MKNISILVSILISSTGLFAQNYSTSTFFPKADEAFTLSVNVESTSLQGYTGDVYLWAWIENGNNDIDAPTNVNPATSSQSDALMTRSESNPNEYSISLTLTDFFNQPVSVINEIGFKLKSTDWNDNKQSDKDLFVKIFDGGFHARILSPSAATVTIFQGDNVEFDIITSETADKISINKNNQELQSITASDRLQKSITIAESGNFTLEIKAQKSGFDDILLTRNIVSLPPTVNQARPTGIIDGINYISNTSVILSLLAPQKQSVYVIGDFNNWQFDPSFQMKKDGEHFWIEINGLTPEIEYGFQYVVDGTKRIADPYADKILDPDDKWIPESIYPNLKEYPSSALSDTWYYNRVSVLETGQAEYVWEVADFQKPQAEDLVIYELLIRDLFSESERSYQNLIDTLNYFERLGVNAIQLMPITEFNGNNSWGYNPTFMFAVDKAYGPKNQLKTFIDEAHKRGIAVILDMVLNHQDLPNPYLVMYWDDKLDPQNPMFNVNATHPFNVFFDMNHESAYTKHYVDTVCHYWLNEYKFDGFRFDLSKGFTQKVSGDDVSAWSAYDASRVNLLKRMADRIWSHSPDAYVILEHFSDNTEEIELSDYGMMLWGNMNHTYRDVAAGRNGNLGSTYYKNKSWNNNLLVSYMESHDEERVVYDVIKSGLSNGDYDTKNLSTALERVKLNSAFFYLVPGPKMLWQFGELGYDLSINTCGDGSIKNDCRIDAKPVLWNYYENPDRLNLYKATAEMIKLRDEVSFQEGEFWWTAFARVKKIKITHEDMNYYVVGNFNTFPEEFTLDLQKTGVWYDFFTGTALTIDDLETKVTLAPGQFHIFTDKKVENVPADLVPWQPPVLTSADEELQGGIRIFPNPSTGVLNITMPQNKQLTGLRVMDLSGRGRTFDFTNQYQTNYKLDLAAYKPGMYLIEIISGNEKLVKKVVRQ